MDVPPPPDPRPPAKAGGAQPDLAAQQAKLPDALAADVSALAAQGPEVESADASAPQDPTPADAPTPQDPTPANAPAPQDPEVKLPAAPLLMSADHALQAVSATALAPERPQRRSIMMAAVQVMESLDPVPAQALEGAGGRVLVLPGMVSLMPLTLVVTSLEVWAALWLERLSVGFLPDYHWPFLIAHGVLIGHVWSYHVAYHTRRRWMAARQLLFMTAIAAFFGWILLDLQRLPEISASPLARKPLTWALWLHAGALSLIWLHALILGRGQRVRRLPQRQVKDVVAS